MMPEQQPTELDPDDLPPGTRLCGGRFVIEACLGRGGVASVYRVRSSDDRRLALKLMVTRRAADGDQRERFDNEWRILRALHGLPYVVSVDSSGRHDDGRPCFTMELVEAPTLAELIAHREVTVARACWVAREVAHALDDLHTRGVVHRDIKPDNIMVTPEGVRLLDFGYAYTRGSEQVPSLAGLTGSEHRPGTALYMAPEQADGEPPTPAFDIYALAVTLYEALVGHAPNSEIPPGLMMLNKCRGSEELSIAGRMAGLRYELEQVIDRGLRRKPGQRVGSAAEFRDRLDAVLEQMGGEDFPAGIQERSERAAGVIEPEDGNETLAFLPSHRRATEQRARPLRPAIGGGRGETKPVPAAVVGAVEVERIEEGLEVPEDLQVEAPEPAEDERAELLALREAARRAAEQAREVERREAMADASDPSQPELGRLREAVRHAEAEAQEAVRRLLERVIPDEELHAMKHGLPILISPEVREAGIKKENAYRAKEALERAEQALREREAAAKALREREAASEAALREREAAAKAEATKKWFAAGVMMMLLLLGVGVWWRLAGESEPQGASLEGMSAQAEPKATPEPAVEPAPQPEPAPSVESETKVAPAPTAEVVPAPEPAPEVAPKPKPGRARGKPKAPRQPEPAPAIEEPCTDVAAEAKAASRDKQWSRVLKLTKSPRCWDDTAARDRLRVNALLELGQLAECVRLGSTHTQPEVQRIAKRCAKQLEEEGTP